MEKAMAMPLPYHCFFLLAPEVVTFVPPFRLAARSPQFVGSVAQLPQTDPEHLISVPPTSPAFFRLPCSCVDLTGLFWTKRCRKCAWKGASGSAEEKVRCGADCDAASPD